jgi:hypothetical protein
MPNTGLLSTCSNILVRIHNKMLGHGLEIGTTVLQTLPYSTSQHRLGEVEGKIDKITGNSKL